MPKTKHISRLRAIFLIGVLSLFSIEYRAQNADTTSHTHNNSNLPPDTTHSPKKATILSAVLPGAGQVYNKKWWKVPIIYAGIGTCVYLAIDRQKQFKEHLAELKYRQENAGQRLNPDLIELEDNAVESFMTHHRSWRDNFYVFTGLVYLINIIDAHVDAHFFTFDVSPDLSLNLKPYTDVTFTPHHTGFVNGISLHLAFQNKKKQAGHSIRF